MPPTVPPTGPTDAFDRLLAQGPSITRRSGDFANVFDLAAARARRSAPAEAPIPQHVLDEMEAASRMFHALFAQGHEVRFDDRSGVRAELRTLEGELVRDVPLTEAVDVLGDPFDSGPEAA